MPESKLSSSGMRSIEMAEMRLLWHVALPDHPRTGIKVQKVQHTMGTKFVLWSGSFDRKVLP